MKGFDMMMTVNAPPITMSLVILVGLVLVWFCVVVSTLNSYHLVASFPPAAVADMLGEDDEVVVGTFSLSFLRKKAFISLNSAARELLGTTLAPEASSSIVR